MFLLALRRSFRPLSLLSKTLVYQAAPEFAQRVRALFDARLSVPIDVGQLDCAGLGVGQF